MFSWTRRVSQRNLKGASTTKSSVEGGGRGFCQVSSSSHVRKNDRVGNLMVASGVLRQEQCSDVLLRRRWPDYLDLWMPVVHRSRLPSPPGRSRVRRVDFSRTPELLNSILLFTSFLSKLHFFSCFEHFSTRCQNRTHVTFGVVFVRPNPKLNPETPPQTPYTPQNTLNTLNTPNPKHLNPHFWTFSRPFC